MEPRFTALLASGKKITESDSVGFADVPQDQLVGFSVNVDGLVVGVHLASGVVTFILPGEEPVHYGPEHLPTTPLRLIYYKTMQASSGSIHLANVYCVTVGWQTTVTDASGQFRNVRYGVKLYPGERRWEVTEDV
jgi:hypothetical protein